MPKGHTNNPNGRPPKARALTARLAAELARKPDNESRSYGEILAQIRVQAALTGMMPLLPPYAGADGEFIPPRTLILESDEVLGLQAELYKQIDGPPKAEVDVTTDGKSLRAPRTTINLKALSDADLDTLAELRRKAEGGAA